MSTEDYEVEDITKNVKSKKIKCGSKGKRGERDIIHLFNNRFAKLLSEHPDWGGFSRSVGSGNRWGQVFSLPQHAKETFSGDITCPKNFKFVLESKCGYNDIDLFNCIVKNEKGLDEFLEQVSADSGRCGKIPILLWKKDRKGRIAFMRDNDVNYKLPLNYIKYNSWCGVDFNYLLSLEDNFFFILE